jgi:hypothetical protein
MLEPLAGFHRPVGQATATALERYVLATLAVEKATMVVYDISVSPASSSPGQKVAGVVLHSVMSSRLVWLPAVIAQPGAMLVQFWNDVKPPEAVLVVPAGQLCRVELEVTLPATGVKELINVGLDTFSTPDTTPGQ